MSVAGYMLDTDIFSYLVDGRHPSVREKVTKNQKKIAVSSITIAEALFRARKKGSQKLESLVNLFREVFPILEWTDKTADFYADIRLALENAGTPIGDMDMMIAAAAMADNRILVTDNLKHFKHVNGLRVESWVN